MDKLGEYYVMIEDLMFGYQAFSYPIYIWVAAGTIVLLTLLFMILLANLVAAIWKTVARSLENFHNKLYGLAGDREHGHEAMPQLKDEIKGLRSTQQGKNTVIKHLKDKIGRLQSAQQKNDAAIQRSKNEIERLKQEKDAVLQRSNNDIRRIQSAQYESAKVIQQLNGEIGRLRTELQEKNDMVKKYATRLSQEMNHKVSADESNVENVGIKNRPMNVADNYETLCSEAWLTAKEALDGRVEDESFKVEYIFRILMCANSKMEELYQLYWFELHELFTKPSAVLGHPSGNPPRPAEGEFDLGNLGLPNALLNVVSDFLRNNDDLDVKDLERSTQEVLKQVEEEWGSIYHSSSMARCKSMPSITSYTLSCLRFCWKMVLQRPQMKFKVTEHFAGYEYQDLYWASVDPTLQQECVVKHVYPMVYHGKHLMKKGKVFLTPHPDSKHLTYFR